MFILFLYKWHNVSFLSVCLNSEFIFLLTFCITKTQEPTMPY